MSKNNYQYLTTFTLAAHATQILDIDLNDISNFQVMIEVTYALTHAASTGVTLTVYDGFGGSDSTATGSIPMVLGGTASASFTTTGTSMTLNTVTTGAVAPQTVKTDINYYIEKVPRWTRLSFYNSDFVNTATILLRADL